MLFAYSLRLRRNTDPRCKHYNRHYSGVLWDFCRS